MELIGKLVPSLKKASSDFTFDYIHKKSCLTLLCHSQDLNQIVAVKFPNRSHYISIKLARDYLQATRRLIDYKFSPSVLKDAYVLNVLISDKLTKSCFELISTSDNNMDMVFNPNRRKTNYDIILGTILKSIYSKSVKWIDKIKKSFRKPVIKNVKSYHGSKEFKDYIEPYGPVKKKIKVLEKASNYLEIRYKKFLKQGRS